MKYVPRIKSPGDLARFSVAELDELSQEIRTFLIEKVSKSGGHLGPNLGIVELTIAIHRVFESPRDVVVFDTGHQSYVHKILTGRAGGFEKLRQRGGIAGYPNRSESEHDVIENSHASTALSWADGIARGFMIQGETERTVVAVVGDGSLTGGMAWEALNNIAASENLRLVIVVNDNERSYSPTIGGVATYLSTLRATKGYEKFLDWGKGVLERTPVVGQPIYETLHGMKKGIKDIVAPQGMFEDLGLKYLGPVDGHDIAALEKALLQAKKFEGPVLVHAITEKGRGHAPALQDEAEKFHAVGVVDPETGEPLSKGGASWTNIFSDSLVEIGRERKDVVAITAAMLGPTGLDRFQKEFPERTFDVGIAEQHATTSAAGMAFTGLRELLRECVSISGAPSIIRFPKGAVAKEIPAFERRDGIDILYRGESADILLVSIGAMASVAVDAAAQAYREGVGVTVIDPRWVKPLPAQSLITLAQRYKRVVVLEDGIKHGGIASTISEIFRENGLQIELSRKRCNSMRMKTLTANRFTNSFSIQVRQNSAEMHRPSSAEQHT